uniref:Protein shuttle craft n=1 Tax=Cuerna arida TaxID=1464854 RepID=A0A1B6EVN5_9HEMI
MSQWGRNYSTNRNQNFYQNSYSYYQQYDGNRTYENWVDYSVPQTNEEGNHSYPQQSQTFMNGAGSYFRDTASSGSNYNSSRVDENMYNVEIDSEILARAANSRLTPTAGEFIPSSSYQSSNIAQFQDSTYHDHSNRIHSASNSRECRNNGATSKTSGTGTSVRDVTYNQKRNFNKVKTRNMDNQRQLNIEQSKEEGRKKLLQEAAGLAASNSNVSGSSRATATISQESSRWRSRAPLDKPSSRSSDGKIFSRPTKSQDHYHSNQRYSSPKITSSGISSRRERSQSNSKGVDDAASQRDRLTDQLNRGTLECLVCCEHVRQSDQTWCCLNCYHVLHLRCIIKWANTSRAENGWRCPACQNVTVTVPKDYYCFCGKMLNPEWSRTDTAHSCGEVCNRSKVLASEYYSCVHRCTLLCHPGPCPPCVALVTRKCGCGRSTQTVQCGQLQPLVCSAICSKSLSCGIHNCSNKCHLGPCQPCEVVINQVCYCGKKNKELECDGKNCEGEKFSCGSPCEAKLLCGQHVCEEICHAEPCGSCPRDPSQVTHCPCGQTQLSPTQLRNSCLDPIPTCGQICSRQLPCGQPSNPHQCKTLCHEGPCPPCDQSTLVRCRCGYMDQEIPCTELTTKADDARCQKKCTKKRTCGKHKCNQMCCIDVDHLCPLPCNHMLSCGQHRCDQLCHRGHCQPCLRSSFEELFCECGSSVVLPPVPCGTKPPPCNKPCSRTHDCDHEVLHMCHSFTECPPCGILTSKYCHGKHELRKAVPCHLKEFSCGRPCGRALSCGRHSCIQSCHGGACVNTCKQPCTKPRDFCGHPCNAPCHEGDCIEAPCKENVVVTCECGHRSMSRPCYENNSEYQRIATSLLASKMADVQLGRSVNLDDMQGPRKFTIKSLECSEECRVVERNRRLAIGLQIRNPDLSAKLTPRYSDLMRAWAKKDQRFCQYVHEKLTELVKLAKESKQKSRSFSFDVMNREKRQFVHEYCTHFGCESVAYDAEPKRNVVATAQRDKAWLPSYSLLEVVQREMGLRKVPLPILNSSCQKSTSQSEVLPVRVTLNQSTKGLMTGGDTDTPAVDYFDYNNS